MKDDQRKYSWEVAKIKGPDIDSSIPMILIIGTPKKGASNSWKPPASGGPRLQGPALLDPSLPGPKQDWDALGTCVPNYCVPAESSLLSLGIMLENGGVGRKGL